MLKRLLFLLPLAAVTILAQAQDEVTAPLGPTMAAVQARGQLICAVDEEVYGFGFLNPNTGEISGLQVDICRALAVATAGDANAVDLRLHPMDTAPADMINAGADVSFHHTYTQSPSEGPVSGLDVGLAAIYYDGVSLMVDGATPISKLEDLKDATVCTVADSLSAQELDAQMKWRELDYDAVSFPTIAEMRAAFEDGRCVAQVLDRSLLEIIRQSMDNPGPFVVWSLPLTNRPVLPILADGDVQWKAIVDWTIWGLIEAEKLGITSQNIDQFMRRSTESDTAYLNRVGESAAQLIGLGSSLGLTDGFMAQVIAEVGNYGEIYDRNLGPDSALVIDRGLNALWRDGGLLEAPTWR